MTSDGDAVALSDRWGAASDATVVVVGGTGSLGRRLVWRLASAGVRVIVFSRDEGKHVAMRHQMDAGADVTFALGDVRDRGRVNEVMAGADMVVHAAALKQVPLCEEAPYEAIKTNVCGAWNVRQAAIKAGVKRVVAISTDKAVAPLNVMGLTKALQERTLLSHGQRYGTEFVCVRYGNVLGSRGSLVPVLAESVRRGRPLPITNPDMTRFVLTMDQAVEFVLLAGCTGAHGDVLVKKLPAVMVGTLASAVGFALAGKWDYPTLRIGARAGEKTHETLIASEEMTDVEECSTYYRLPAARGNEKSAVQDGAYRSDGGPLMDAEEALALVEESLPACDQAATE